MEHTRVVLIRHAQSESNAAAICECRGDSPLTARGKGQAARLARRLESQFPTASALYSSPLGRARQTAEIIGRRLKLPVERLGDLREIHVGRWEGLPLSEVDLMPLHENADFTFHGGESPRQFSTRAAQAVRQLVEDHPGETVLAVGHGTVLAGAIAFLLGKEPLFGNPYTMKNGGAAVLAFGPFPKLCTIDRVRLPQRT